MFVLIFNQLMKMLLIMIASFVLFRLGVVNQEGSKAMSNVLLTFVNPALLLNVFQSEYDPELVHGLLIAFAAAIVSNLIAIVLVKFLIPARGNPDAALEKVAAMYSNCGFIGIPIIQSVLGSEGVFYMSAYIIIFNIFIWTHGFTVIRGRFDLATLKEGMRSPLLITAFVSILLFFLHVRFPAVIRDTLGYVADMNTPLAMMIAGFSVAQADLKKTLRKLRIYWVCAVKLIIIPLACALCFALAKLPYNVAYTIFIGSACPTAALVTMIAIRYDQDYRYSSEIYSVTTLFSMFTIPAVSFIADFFLHP